MVTTSNIEPRQVAFSDPAHVIRPNLVYGGVAVAGAGVGAVGGKIDMKHGVTAATEAVGAATRWARRQHHQCVFYRQLLKGGAKDTMVSDARGRTTCGRSRSLLRVRESEEVARKSFDRIKSRKGMTRSSAFSLVRTHRRRRTRMSLNEARVPYNNRNRRHTTATNLV
jgi:hypothetical protein